MKFAVALFALTFMSQSFIPAYAETANEELASAPILEGAAVNAVGAEGGARSKHMQLSDQQKEKLFELKNKLLTDAGPKKLQLAEQRRLLKDLLTKDSLDRKAIQSAQDKINSLRADLANVQIAFRMDLQEELTPEQRKIMRYRSLKPGRGKAHQGKKHHRSLPKATEESGTTIGTDTTLNVEEYAPANI